MRLHVLGFPHTETTAEWSACAYTQRTKDFASFMKHAGHEVYLYAGEYNEADVTEHVVCVTRKNQMAWFPDFDKSKVFNDFNDQSFPWRAFNQKCFQEILMRKQPGDILCLTMGVCHRAVAKLLEDLIHVETGIGYAGVWAPYRVFESKAWQHYLAAKEKTDDLRWYDTVIPRGYFLDQFPAGRGGKDFLFLGRLTARKGPQVAADACRRIGARLLVAGQGAAKVEPGCITTDEGLKLEGDVHYLGVLSPSDRATALRSVRAVFMPTYYLEPGGGVAIEAQLCGTPVITTPWGAMTETVLPGKTGFHCSTLSEFVTAAQKAHFLDRRLIRLRAEQRYAAPVIAEKYDKYFKKLIALKEGQDWYAV